MLKNKFVYKKTKQPKQPGHCPPCLITIAHYSSFPKLQDKRNLSNISQPFMKKWKPDLFTSMPYMSTSLCWKKWDSFNIRLNNNRKDAKSQYSILVCKHCYKQDHDFRHAEFTLIEQINTQPPEKQEHIK